MHVGAFLWDALERVIDQYQVSTDKRSGITATTTALTTKSTSCGWSGVW